MRAMRTMRWLEVEPIPAGFLRQLAYKEMSTTKKCKRENGKEVIEVEREVEVDGGGWRWKW